MSEPKSGKRKDGMTREAAEEYSASLAQIGEGWWRQLAWAYQQGVPEAMNLSLREWRDTYYGHLRMPLSERKDAVAELAESGLSNREISKVLGVSHQTVARDSSGPNGPEKAQPSLKTLESTDSSGPNGPPPARTVEIRRCDFRELLGSLTDVDAIITDPPYKREERERNYPMSFRPLRYRPRGGGDAMTLPDPPDGLLLVPLAKGCILLLTPREYVAGLRRGKWWRRRQRELARLPDTSQDAPTTAPTGALQGT